MLLRLLKGLDKSTFEITLFSQSWDEFCNEVTQHNVTIKIVQYPGLLNKFGGELLDVSPVSYPAVLGRIIQYNINLATHLDEPDILWFSGPRTFLFTYPNQLFRSSPTILNFGLLPKSSGKMKYINELCLRGTNHVFIESESQARRQLSSRQWELYESKFTIFNKGIDVNEFNPSKYSEYDDDHYSVGTAALINPRKGLEYFIDAAAKVIEDRSDVHFTIAGEPAREDDKLYKQELNDRIHEHGIADHIEFLGWVDDMPTYLNTLDVFVLPSYNEGIPGAIREALAMEVPVVATDIGGTSEAVIDGKTGYLVEPEDAEQIAIRIDQLLNDQSMRAAFGKQGRQHMVENFSIESYVRNYEEFLNEIAAN